MSGFKVRYNVIPTIATKAPITSFQTNNIYSSNENHVLPSFPSLTNAPTQGNVLFTIGGTLYYRSNDNTITVLGIN